jgi:hypothetical protein
VWLDRSTQFDLGDGDDTQVLDGGTVSKPLRIVGGRGNDLIRIVDAVLSAGLTADTGDGDDTFVFDDSLVGRDLRVITGGGSDRIEIDRAAGAARTSRVAGRLSVNAGAADDQIHIGTADLAALFGRPSALDGGVGLDTVTGLPANLADSPLRRKLRIARIER